LLLTGLLAGLWKNTEGPQTLRVLTRDTSATSIALKSSGSTITCVVASRYGVFS